MNDKPFSAEFVTEAVKGTPPVAMAASVAAGVDWQEWVLILTALLIVLQIVHLVLFKMFGFSFGKRKVADDG